MLNVIYNVNFPSLPTRPPQLFYLIMTHVLLELHYHFPGGRKKVNISRLPCVKWNVKGDINGPKVSHLLFLLDLILHQLKVYTYATINFRIYKLVLAMLYAQQQRVQEY